MGSEPTHFPYVSVTKETCFELSFITCSAIIESRFNMKTRHRSILAFCAALCMFASVAMPAWAAVESWTENGYLCVACVEKDGDAYVIPVPIDSASVVHHDVGSTEVITWPLGYVATRTFEYDVLPSPTDIAYLKQAAIKEGVPLVSMSCELSNPILDCYVLDAGLPAGTYSYGAEFTVYDATWSVRRSQISGWALVDPTSGTFTGIPISCTDSKMIVIELD